jgi:L-lactate utilization protein LutC
MSGDREAFFDRIRRAVAAGNRAGDAATLPERGAVGYQGAGDDLVGRFATELTAVGGVAHLVADVESAAAKVMELLREKRAQRVVVGRGTMLDKLALSERLRIAGIETVVADSVDAAAWRAAAFAADVGISGVELLVAETGSIVVETRPDQPRGLSLLPPVHIAVAERRQLLPDLFDIFAESTAPPACLSIITGPSKTGDIELRLVTGVHGPGEVHVVLIV